MVSLNWIENNVIGAYNLGFISSIGGNHKFFEGSQISKIAKTLTKFEAFDNLNIFYQDAYRKLKCPITGLNLSLNDDQKLMIN